MGTVTLPTAYSQFIHLSRYARWVDSEKRRETWEETVNRYINFFATDKRVAKIPADVMEELRQAILNLEVMPSMRCMMTAGKALEIDNVAAFNCLSGDTLVTTKEMGIVPISKVAGKSVHVVDGNGKWTLAPCRNYGRQKLMRVALSSSGRAEDFVIRATPNHRWIMRDGTEKTTSELKVGDGLAFVGFPGNAKKSGFGMIASVEDDREEETYCFDVPTTHSFLLTKNILTGNCAFVIVDDISTFDEMLYILMCLAPDTMIRTESGCRPISQITPSDKVLSRKDNGEYEYVSPSFVGETPSSSKRKIEIEFEDGHVVRVTEDHRFLTDRGWVEAKDLMEKDEIRNYHEVMRLIRKTDCGRKGELWMRLIRKTEIADNRNYWDMTIPVNHNFVLANGIVVHNCGTGVGFSVERQFICNLPAVADRMLPSRTIIKVEDSRVGWADAYRELISMLYQGRVPEWDVSEVRPAGARLKTFGGRASGPQPLIDLFKFTIDIFKQAVGRRLTSIECHDICCKIGEIVVVGGVRRSAEISLSNLSDDRMRHAKDGNWYDTTPWRSMANDSAAYSEKPDMGAFFREWLSLFESKSGERGIFNRQAAKAQVAKYGRRDPNHPFGTNPCSEIILRSRQFCVSGDTPLVMVDGIADIGSLQDKSVRVWNGSKWTGVVVRKTGVGQKLLRVRLSDGSYLDCTPYHRWSVRDRFAETWHEVQAKDLMSFSKYALQVEPANVVSPVDGDIVTDAYTFGFAVGDGCVYDGKVIIDLHGSKDWDCPVVGIRRSPQWNFTRTSAYVRTIANEAVDPNRLLRFKGDISAWRELGEWHRSSVLEFVAGLADADGSETGTGGIRVYVNMYEKARMLQLVLAKHGIKCSVNLCQKAGVETNLAVRQHDLWYIQITDCCCIPCCRLDTSGGHVPKFKGKYQNIESVEELPGEHDVYCFEEPETHKAMFGNVLTYQCNLSEVVIRPEDSLRSLKRKVRLATILGTMQATLTNFHYLRPEWKKNTEEEALLGVSLTGIMDNVMMSAKLGKDVDGNGTEELKKVLGELREHAVKVNKEFASKIGINPAAAITCVKPSGCTTMDTRIKTDKGILSFAEIFEMNGVNPLSLQTGMWIDLKFELRVFDCNNNPQLVKKLYVNGIAEVYEIEDEMGNIFRFTGNHKLLTKEGWKRVDSLTTKDEIVSFD